MTHQSMWDDEDQNALLDQESLICMGDEVILQYTNPGVAGRIVGIYDPRVYYGGMRGDHADSKIKQWAAYCNQSFHDIRKQRIYAIMFPEPQDNGIMSDSVPEQVKAAQRIRIAITPEADIMIASEYWDNFVEADNG